MITTKQLVKTLARLFDTSGDGAPTDATAGQVGDRYMDSATGLTYELVEIEADPTKYIWVGLTQLDAEIDLMISRAEADYLQLRGVEFAKGEHDEIIYPPAADVTAAEMVCYLTGIGRYTGRGYGSASLGGRNATYDRKILGYPVSIVGSITRYQGVK